MDTLRLLFYLMLGANLASTLSLKGGDFPCTQPDGQEIRVPGITDVPTSVKIKCICQKGVGKCQHERELIGITNNSYVYEYYEDEGSGSGDEENEDYTNPSSNQISKLQYRVSHIKTRDSKWL